MAIVDCDATDIGTMIVRRGSVLRFEQRQVNSSGWRVFRKRVMDAVKKGGKTVVVDLVEARYLFSGVLNALIEARVIARRTGGRIVIVAGDRLAKFLESIGFDRLFEVVGGPSSI